MPTPDWLAARGLTNIVRIAACCVDELVAFKPGTSEIVELTAEERKEVRDWIELHHDHDADRRGDPDAAYETWRDDQMDRRDDWGGEGW